MRKIILKFLPVTYIFLLALSCARPAYAHGDDARIELSAERLSPGGVLDIRGVGFEPETEIGLLLIGRQADFPMGTAISDVEGVFQLTAILPVELVEGAYVIHGTSEDGHTVASPELRVWGSADLGSADGELREEDDGLLAPMPTIPAGAPTPMLSSVPQRQGSVETEPSTPPYEAIAAGVGITVLLGLILFMKKK